MSSLAEALAEKLEGDASLDLVKLESGAVIALDRTARWVLKTADGPTIVFDAESAHAFAEVLERPRDAFDGELGSTAQQAGLDPTLVINAFPAIPIVRAVIAKRFAYLVRLALLWVLPSELRDLRPELVVLAEEKGVPGPVRDLARRLIVPDRYD